MNNFLVALNFAFVYLFWGSTYLAIQVVVSERIPPAMMGAVRFSVAGLVLMMVCAFLRKKLTLPPRTLVRVGVIAVLLLTTGNVVLGWAEEYIPTGYAALLIAMTPLWMTLIDRFIFKGAPLPTKSLLGLFLGLVGIVLLVWPKLSAANGLSSQIWFGSGLVLISSLSWATGSVLSRRWSTGDDVLVATAWEMLLAGMVNMAIAFALGDHHTAAWTAKGTTALAYLIAAGSLIGYTAYVWLLKNVPISKVSTYAYVNPIVAVFLGWFVLNENVDPFVFIGAAVIVASVWLINSSKVQASNTSE